MRSGKTKNIYIFLAPILALPLLILIASNAPARNLPNFRDALGNEELTEKIIAEMTDKELLAQILMFGWAGSEPNPQVIAWVKDHSLGSVKIFGWNTDNTDNVAKSVTLLQKTAAAGRFGIPLFVATDQEGGQIRHIKGKTTETPGNLAIGASGLPLDAWYTGYYISRELRALGINLNFAPTVDLFTNHESTLIGTRSFGESPEAAGILGASFVAGSRAAGVLTTAKHFPGHGDTKTDSHGKLPVIDISEKKMTERELIPFQSLIDAKVPAIMSGHLSFPQVLGNGEPATFSKYLLDGILRKKMGFTGLIITDDIMMNGATEYAGSVSNAVRLAIEAGNDIIESSTTPNFSDALWVNTLERMRRSPDFRARVSDAARRVILAKLAYFKSDETVPIYPDLGKIDERIPDRDGQDFFLSQAVRSVTLVRGTVSTYIPKKGGSLLIASSFPEFLAAGTKRFPNANTAGINNQLFSQARKYDTVIFCLANRESLEILKDLRTVDTDLIVISAMSPALLSEVPWVDSALAIYSYSHWSFTAAFGAIAGDFIPEGVMPIRNIK